MRLDELENIRSNIASIWDQQTQQLELFRVLKEEDENDIDDETLEEIMAVKRREAATYERLLDRFDSIIQKHEEE